MKQEIIKNVHLVSFTDESCSYCRQISFYLSSSFWCQLRSLLKANCCFFIFYIPVCTSDSVNRLDCVSITNFCIALYSINNVNCQSTSSDVCHNIKLSRVAVQRLFSVPTERTELTSYHTEYNICNTRWWTMHWNEQITVGWIE